MLRNLYCRHFFRQPRIDIKRHSVRLSHTTNNAASSPDSGTANTLDKNAKTREVQAGIISAEACLEAISSPQGATNFVKQVLRGNDQIAPLGYAALIRHCTEKGQYQDAERLMSHALTPRDNTRFSSRDSDALRRAHLLGLVVAKDLAMLEKVHRRWCSYGLDSVSTWNVLLRARLDNGRLKEAIAGLDEMRSRQVNVEHATAARFKNVLFCEKPPAGPVSTWSEQDLGAQKALMLKSIGILTKCFEQGRRTQPETWYEVMRRLSLSGEHDALVKLTDGLIPQYSTQNAASQRSSNVVATQDSDSAGSVDEEAKDGLTRLIPVRLMTHLVDHGFNNGNPARPIQVLRRWQAQGVVIPYGTISARVRMHLSKLDDGASASSERTAAEKSIKTLLYRLRIEGKEKHDQVSQ